MKTLPRNPQNNDLKAGQVLMEYFIVFAMTVGILVMLALFLGVFKEYGNRILDLIAGDFP